MGSQSTPKFHRWERGGAGYGIGFTENTVLLSLARSDQIANYDKLGGNVHAGSQCTTDFDPSAAHLEIHHRRISEIRRWCELKSAAKII
jgi:hypothetical protein